MSRHLFRSMRAPVIEVPSTAEQMAIDLARDQVDIIKEARAAAKAREEACEALLPATLEHTEAYRTLDALLRGRHRRAVLRLLFEEFPEMVVPVKLTPDEDARLQALAEEAVKS